ncbi:MAPEG family protein [Dasania sp. GY-MA-18]|uniref:MAPEG family protein n=1 Tax=Dasania phycosphaerae TaxID=2950436 RepID=A0A9J6RLQ2_9GAMM|nr:MULTISPECIES: MAPEG family protein [Dasania]MCR8923004.1 MAPEG family protein [Dasania sp. GY-MA-18]MCZ0865435.1 MAPEG family protein [Dasania phycosphaerae]MCZ0869160.1 MAPEG family protein [Dasania phycosphaerae]
MINAMFAVVMLTTVIGFVAVRARKRSVRLGQVDRRYYQLMQGYEPPDTVIKSTRCLNNMFEVPMLFYVVCCLYVALGLVSTLAIAVAWLFVLCRAIQAYIHLGCNNVSYRMYAFGAGLLCVLALWINLMVTIA